MLIEFCEGGAIDSIMLDLEKSLTEPQIKYVCREMCKGLKFLHENKVIHRDLKAGNVLLTLDGEVKIGNLFVASFLLYSKLKFRVQLTLASRRKTKTHFRNVILLLVRHIGEFWFEMFCQLLIFLCL